MGDAGHGWEQAGLWIGTNTSLKLDLLVKPLVSFISGFWSNWYSDCWTELMTYLIITFDLIYFQIFNISCTNRCHVCNDTMAREQCIPLHIRCICTNVESYKYVSQFPCFCKVYTIYSIIQSFV
jgi:hypothetical protein